MLQPLLTQPFIALILIAITCSLLGVFVLWKKLAYFGDALSHSILLGLVIGTIFNLDQTLVLILFTIAFSLLLSFSFDNRYFSKDTIIAIASYLCVSLAMVLSDIFAKDFDFSSYILGDITNIEANQIYLLAIIATLSIAFFVFAFKKILLININSDLAKISGINCEFWNLAFLVLLTLTIALSVKIVGIFLMTSLLILPAAIARIFCLSSKAMAAYSLLISIIASLASIEISSSYNFKISATLISLLSLTFMVGFLSKKYGKF